MNKNTTISRILALLLVAAVTISVMAIPADVNAASKRKHKKPKVTCSISFKNIDGNTVIKKGKKLKIIYSSKSSNGKKVKVRFRSSNRRVATVSRKGVIKAKKNGTVKITVTGYIRGRKGGSRTVKIRVGRPVTGVSISGYKYLRAGRTTRIKSSVSPGNATNKKLIWSSSNPRAAKVDQAGNITGVGNGSAVITVKAADGAGAQKSITVYSHRYTKGDTLWIAHRGLHEKAKENTADAFRLAGQAGFWGAECDIWETRHIQREASAETVDSADNDLDIEIVEEEAPPEKTTVEDFDIVITHDSNLKRVFGVDLNVEDSTAEQIRSNSKLSQVCFFDEYLKICKQYGMVPIIEIKDYDLSDAGIEKLVGMVNDAGLLETAQFISFDATVLERTQDYTIKEYGIRPYCGYLIGWGDVASAVRLAKKKNFSGVNILYTLLTLPVNKQCNDLGLKICTWTYGNSAYSDDILYRHILSGQYDIMSTTADGKFF